MPDPDANQCRLIFEFEHLETGSDAGELALRIMNESVPELEWESNSELAEADLKDMYGTFLALAKKHVLPLDALAIIDAAARMDVPCVKLEREPYGVLEGDFRIRRNGLLKLGHSCYQHITDGTLCIDRTPELAPLLFDREKLFQFMLGLGLPLPRQDREFRNIVSARRAVRSAERIGYPVVPKLVRKPRDKKPPVGHTLYSNLPRSRGDTCICTDFARERRRVMCRKTHHRFNDSLIHWHDNELVGAIDALGFTATGF